MMRSIYLMLGMLVHVISLFGQQLDTTFPEAFLDDPNGFGFVGAMAVEGDVIYVGGNFSMLGGQDRNHLGAIDLTTNQVTGWAPEADGLVLGMAVSEGIVYVWGEFQEINGQPRNNLAAIDEITGELTDFNPIIQFPSVPGLQLGTISDVAISGDTLFLVGYFIAVNGQNRKNLALIRKDGTLLSWNSGTDVPIDHILVDDASIYVSGPFYSPKSGLVAFNRSTGGPTAWNPAPNMAGNGFGPMLKSGNDIIVSGPFTKLQGQDHPYMGKVDALTGQPTGWDAGFTYGNPVSVLVRDMIRDGDRLYVGGHMTSSNGGLTNLGVLDWNTGEVGNWQPEPDMEVMSMALSGQQLIVGGFFNQIAGTSRSHLARFDLGLSGVHDPGEQLNWTVSPNPSDGLIQLQLPELDVLVRVMDLTGREVHSASSRSQSFIGLDLRHLQPGAYIVNASSEGGSGTQLIILQ